MFLKASGQEQVMVNMTFKESHEEQQNHFQKTPCQDTG